MANSSISISMALIRASVRNTSSPALRSFWVTALMLRWMEDSTIALISSSLVFSCSSSSTKCRTIDSRFSTETSRYVIFRLFFRRVLEDDGGVVEFDQTAQQEKASVVGDARRLLHVMRHDYDGATALELEDQ